MEHDIQARTRIGTAMRVVFACIAVLVSLGPMHAYAADDCGLASAQSVSLGGYSPFELQKQALSIAPPPITMRCVESGGLVVPVVSSIRSANRKNLVFGSSKIPYQLALYGAQGKVDLGYSFQPASNANDIVSRLQRSDTSMIEAFVASTRTLSSQSAPGQLRVTIPAGSLPKSLAAGVYEDTVTINWGLIPCRLVSGVVGMPVTAYECTFPNRDWPQRVSDYFVSILGQTIKITLTVKSDCQVSAQNIDFGEAPSVEQLANVAQSAALALTCTTGTKYTIALGAGLHATMNGRRRMLGSAHGQLMEYDMFTDASRRVVWNMSPSNSVSKVFSAGGATESLPVTASIYSDQKSQSGPFKVDAYTDTVTVNISY